MPTAETAVIQIFWLLYNVWVQFCFWLLQ